MWSYQLCFTSKNNMNLGVCDCGMTWADVVNTDIRRLTWYKTMSRLYLIFSKNCWTSGHWTDGIWHPCTCENRTKNFVIMIRTNGDICDSNICIIRASIIEFVLQSVKETVRNVCTNFWHFWLRFVNQFHLYWRQYDDLIPWNKNGACLWTEWSTLKL